MGTSARQRLFEAARRRAGLSLERLWLDYMALGGQVGLAELQLFLQGLMPLAEAQQDVLAHALNERLDDLHVVHRLPCCTLVDEDPRGDEPMAVVRALVPAHRGEGPPHRPGWRRRGTH
jgi:hypothetical protein